MKKKVEKLSTSRSSARSFPVQARPLSKETEEKLRIAAIRANEKIAHNNVVYSQSAAGAHQYPVGGGGGYCYGSYYNYQEDNTPKEDKPKTYTNKRKSTNH